MLRPIVAFLSCGLFISSIHANGIPEEKYSVEERSIAQLQSDLKAGHITSEQLVRAYLKRITTLDQSGPHLRAVLSINPDALTEARALDRERSKSGARGPLHGIPILLKDNIESADRIPTTAGSLALARNISGVDASVVAALREAGAIILGKANLSEWANFRSEHSINGWSAVGGLTRNPYVLDRTPCGSSSGSAVAVAASLTAASLGTETDGSITCPASVNGVVGLKPTFGLLHQDHIVPIAHSQDTAGPLGRSVEDVALMLAVMTKSPNLAAALSAHSLEGKRVGVLTASGDQYPELDVVYEAARQSLRAAGATLIDVQLQGGTQVYAAEKVVLLSQFKQDIDAYLSATPAQVTTRSLADLIEFNRRTPRELELFDEELFVHSQSAGGVANPSYRAALELGKQWARTSLEELFVHYELDAIVGPTSGPAWRIDVVNGDHATKAFGAIPAVAGYPHLTVPMGFIRELPVGMSFIGKPNSEAELLGIGFAFEQAARARRAPKFIPTVDDLDHFNSVTRRTAFATQSR